MRVTILAIMICFGMILSAFCQVPQFQRSTDVIDPRDIKLISYQEFSYPSSAHNVQGVVVVRVKLDKSGGVLDAEALSGNDVFIEDTLKNVKTWRFSPNATGIAIVVFRFQIVQGKCKSASSFFTFEPPNLVTITACWPETTPNLGIPAQKQAVVRDNEMEVQDFEDIGYPILALKAAVYGIVVVQAGLSENGLVVEASPIMGNALLIPDCLANVKKWRFRPNKKKSAVIIYHFTFVNMVDGGQKQSVLYPPNYVTITAAREALISY